MPDIDKGIPIGSTASGLHKLTCPECERVFTHVELRRAKAALGNHMSQSHRKKRKYTRRKPPVQPAETGPVFEVREPNIPLRYCPNCALDLRKLVLAMVAAERIK